MDMDMDVDVDVDAEGVAAAHSASEEVEALMEEEAHTADESADEQAGAGEPQSLTQRVSKAVWELLESVLPKESPYRKAEQPPQLDIVEARLRGLQQNSELLSVYVGDRVSDVYDTISTKVFKGLRSDILTKVTEILEDVQQTAADPETMKLLEKAFGGSYSGDADARFQRHLVRCCERYYENRVPYTAPYVTIMQSSGFGKSRLLYQLAKKLARSNKDQPGSDSFDMRFLYVCARNVERSSGFPVATPELSRFFFKDANIANRLLVALEYACADWESAKNDWLGLFGVNPTDTDAGESLVSALSHEKMVGDDSAQEPTPKKRRRSSGETSATSDHDLALALALETTKLEANAREPTPKKSRSSPEPVKQDQRVQVLVLAIDEARSLLEKKDASRINYFRLLRRALTKVNSGLHEEKRKAMIFAVLVDTNSQIHDFVPPLSRDSSSRNDKEKETRLFPPFVLTHTMDVVLNRHRSPGDPPFDYKASVLEGDPDKVWGTLVSMGRPLWHSYVTSATKDSSCGVLFLAGSKLLCGWSPVEKESYAAKTLHGVAPLLCRLGLRSQSSSAFASQVVADFMAVLHYVNYTHEAHICGYLTEPVLAFAATHLWYELTPLPLQEYILPQFQELLMQGVIDVGGIGEVVARIFLLLAMDATIMSREPGSFTLSGGKNRFKGQFCSVKQFLGQLDGSCKPRTEDKAGAKDKAERSGNAGPKLFNVTIKKKKMVEGATGQKKAKSGAKKEATVDSKKSASKRERQRASGRGRQTADGHKGKSAGGRGQQHTSVMETGGTGPTKAEGTKKVVKIVMEVTDDASPEQKTSFKSWMSDWEGWSVGFSHFVELTAMPTEATLWFLLGRRAAGLFPRNQKGADLIIPIFRKSTGEVSFILVQVKNKNSTDSGFPQSALGKLTPASVFEVNEDNYDKHELSEFSPRKMIRIFMSLRESNMNKPAQSYLIDKAGATCVDEESYSLCLRGTCRLPKRGSEASLTYWPFLLSPKVSDQLACLADSAWWDPSARIKADIVRRSKETTAAALKGDMPDEELEEGVDFTLQLVPYVEAGAENDVEMKAAVEG